jgi:hypothetical protein
MFLFGSGILWGTPLTDAAGAAIANPTPLIFGTLQDTELDIKFELKQLHGQNQFAVAVGRGKGSISGKAKMADIRAGFLETIVFGVSGSAGLTSMVYDTVGTAVPTTPFQVTVTPPSSGTFGADLGVIDSTTGRALTRVASAPAAGQYTVTAGGQYTFNTGDQGKVMYINYRYTATSTVARRMSITNLPMGYAPSFRADFYGPYQGKSAVLTLNSCISEGFKMGSKNDDFTVPEVGFQAFADASGVIGTLAVSE